MAPARKLNIKRYQPPVEKDATTTTPKKKVTATPSTTKPKKAVATDTTKPAPGKSTSAKPMKSASVKPMKTTSTKAVTKPKRTIATSKSRQTNNTKTKIKSEEVGAAATTDKSITTDKTVPVEIIKGKPPALSTNFLQNLLTDKTDWVPFVVKVVSVRFKKKHYRVSITDGKTKARIVIVSQLAHLCRDGWIKPDAIIQLNLYACTIVEDNKMVVIASGINVFDP